MVVMTTHESEKGNNLMDCGHILKVWPIELYEGFDVKVKKSGEMMKDFWIFTCTTLLRVV